MKTTLSILILSSSMLFGASSKLDDKTALVWQDNLEIATIAMNQEKAMKYCQTLRLDGFDDWRLPTLGEVYTIVDMKRDRPALKDGFENRLSENFWTSTPFAENPNKKAWLIAMSYGEAEPQNKKRDYSVRCVRGGEVK